MAQKWGKHWAEFLLGGPSTKVFELEFGNPKLGKHISFSFFPKDVSSQGFSDSGVSYQHHIILVGVQ